MITVRTTNAVYHVDRANNRWQRDSVADPRPHDGSWIAGGFTIGLEGGPCYAHYDNPAGSYRRTSRLISVQEDEIK